MDDAEDEQNDIAPRPRPGFRSRRDSGDATQKAALFAGVLRAGVGCAGLFAALLYLPILNVTPILAGVSILMMVTGCTSTWRSVRDVPALRKLPYAVMGGCALVIVATLVVTVVLGAGALGPIAKASARAKHLPHDDTPTVSFQPTP